jgi:hypothetical protein
MLRPDQAAAPPQHPKSSESLAPVSHSLPQEYQRKNWPQHLSEPLAMLLVRQTADSVVASFLRSLYLPSRCSPVDKKVMLNQWEIEL